MFVAFSHPDPVLPQNHLPRGLARLRGLASRILLLCYYRTLPGRSVDGLLHEMMTGWGFGTWFFFFHLLGMSSSQLTNSYFSRWLKPPTSDDQWPIFLGLKHVETTRSRSGYASGIPNSWRKMTHCCLWYIPLQSIISHFSPWYPHDNQWYFHFLAPQNSSRSLAPFFRSSSSWTARKIKGAAGRVQRWWMNVEFQWVLSMDWWEHRKPWFLQSNIGFAWSNFPIIQCYDFKCELNI